MDILKLEYEKQDKFKDAFHAAMDTLAPGESFEVPFHKLRYAQNIVCHFNAEHETRFKVRTMPRYNGNVLLNDKTVRVIRVK